MQRNRANSFLLIYNKHPKRDCNELQYCTVVNVKYQIYLYTKKKEQFNVSIHKQTQVQVNVASPGSENATQSVFNPTLIPVKVINSF